jgi:hypothetical protein
MSDWGFWEWVAYGSTWVAAIGMAIGSAIKNERHLLEKVPAPLKATWWGYVPIGLLTIGLVGFLISWFGGEQKPSKPLMSEYGVAVTGTRFVARYGHPEDVPPGQASHIKLDGSRVMYLNPKKYRLMGVLYHIPPNVDRVDVNGISKSTEFDIRGEQIDIQIPWNQKFIGEFVNGEKMSAYALLAVPVGITGAQFDTLRQAEALGARILEEGGGPP